METTWVYITSEPGLLTVGFYDPSGKFQSDSDHADREAAARRVSFLNGGAPEPAPSAPTKVARPLRGRRVDVSLPVTKEFLADVLTTVIESPFGTWFQWERIRRDRELRVVGAHLKFDLEKGDEGNRGGSQVVTLDVVRVGLEVVLSSRLVNSTYSGAILAAAMENDASHLDMVSADAIVQAAIYGKVVYG